MCVCFKLLCYPTNSCLMLFLFLLRQKKMHTWNKNSRKILLLTSRLNGSAGEVWIANESETLGENSCLRLDLYWFYTFLPTLPSLSQCCFWNNMTPLMKFYFVTNWISVYVLYLVVCFVFAMVFLFCSAVLKSTLLIRVEDK